MIRRKQWAARAAGYGLHAYINGVMRTTRFAPLPGELPPWERTDGSFIALTWHGQQMLSVAALRGAPRTSVLVSLHFDGSVIATALARAGYGTIRGSGTQTRAKIRGKCGIPAFLAMRQALETGTNVLMTADVPKVARVAGKGAVQLARATGRPIFLFAAVTSARIDLDNWDKASLVLPFGRGCVLWSEALTVAGDADAAEIDAVSHRITMGLDDLHAEAHRRLRSGS